MTFLWKATCSQATKAQAELMVCALIKTRAIAYESGRGWHEENVKRCIECVRKNTVSLITRNYSMVIMVLTIDVFY